MNQVDGLYSLMINSTHSGIATKSLLMLPRVVANFCMNCVGKGEFIPRIGTTRLATHCIESSVAQPHEER